MKLGDVVRDTVSGFGGVATCRLEYMNGRVRWAVSPMELHEGKPIEAQYFDAEQLEIVPEPKVNFVRRAIERVTGGDRPAPPARGNLR